MAAQNGLARYRRAVPPVRGTVVAGASLRGLGPDRLGQRWRGRARGARGTRIRHGLHTAAAPSTAHHRRYSAPYAVTLACWAMQSDAWSWHAQAADAQLPEARRQPRLWPSAVLADVPGWGGFEAQAAVDEWPRQTGSGPEEPALRHTAPDADEQQLAEQARIELRARTP